MCDHNGSHCVGVGCCCCLSACCDDKSSVCSRCTFRIGKVFVISQVFTNLDAVPGGRVRRGGRTHVPDVLCAGRRLVGRASTSCRRRPIKLCEYLRSFLDVLMPPLGPDTVTSTPCSVVTPLVLAAHPRASPLSYPPFSIIASLCSRVRLLSPCLDSAKNLCSCDGVTHGFCFSSAPVSERVPHDQSLMPHQKAITAEGLPIPVSLSLCLAWVSSFPLLFLVLILRCALTLMFVV